MVSSEFFLGINFGLASLFLTIEDFLTNSALFFRCTLSVGFIVLYLDMSSPREVLEIDFVRETLILHLLFVAFFPISSTDACMSCKFRYTLSLGED